MRRLARALSVATLIAGVAAAWQAKGDGLNQGKAAFSRFRDLFLKAKCSRLRPSLLHVPGRTSSLSVLPSTRAPRVFGVKAKGPT